MFRTRRTNASWNTSRIRRMIRPLPRQSSLTCNASAELLALAVASALLMLVLDRRAGHATRKSVIGYLERFSPNTLTPLLIGIGGVTLLVHAGGGLYWLLAAAVASLLGGVVSAWLFLAKVTG